MAISVRFFTGPIVLMVPLLIIATIVLILMMRRPGQPSLLLVAAATWFVTAIMDVHPDIVDQLGIPAILMLVMTIETWIALGVAVWQVFTTRPTPPEPDPTELAATTRALQVPEPTQPVASAVITAANDPRDDDPAAAPASALALAGSR